MSLECWSRLARTGCGLSVVVALIARSVVQAGAIVGGATAAPDAIARHMVLIVGSHGTSCSGTAVARDLVLTASHCVMPGSVYKIVEFDAGHTPRLRDVARVAQHPQFNLATMLAHRATADVALLKLAEPLPSSFTPAAVGALPAITPGARFTVAGFGVSVRGDGRGGGTARIAQLVATGQPGPLQLRLVDPATEGKRSGLSACTGDSGAPVFGEVNGRLTVIGVVSWSTGPNASAGCGGITGVTPLAKYRGWIVEQAAKMGSALTP